MALQQVQGDEKRRPRPIRVLVIDVGGTNVKILVNGKRKVRKQESGPSMTARQMVQAVQRLAADWSYDVISLGYPGSVRHGRPAAEPKNLGHGWVGFDFQKAFGCPVKVINDAAMQALGSYNGSRMLFLGLGTGLGSAFITDGVLVPMELSHLRYRKGRTYEDYVGLRGLKRYGETNWRRYVAEVVAALRDALQADYVVLGGGNARKLKRLPEHTYFGDNKLAFNGGFRLWKASPILAAEQTVNQAAAAEDAYLTQRLIEQEESRILKEPAAGVLSKVQGP